jgi:C4-dicarboxylate-specific signal transduction histidine kinase
LTLDIESLGAEHRSSMLQRAKRSMRYIDEMVLQVRDQLRGKGRLHVFNVSNEIKAVINILRHKADQAGVEVMWQEPEIPGGLRCKGDTLRFRQLLANIISNGIDAYEPGKSPNKRQVLVRTERKGKFINVVVEDWGKGVDPKLKDKLFEPFFGSKKGGLGLGLFISKQIVHDHFAGDIKIQADKNHTTFVISVKAHQ